MLASRDLVDCEKRIGLSFGLYGCTNLLASTTKTALIVRPVKDVEKRLASNDTALFVEAQTSKRPPGVLRYRHITATSKVDFPVPGGLNKGLIESKEVSSQVIICKAKQIEESVVRTLGQVLSCRVAS